MSAPSATRSKVVPKFWSRSRMITSGPSPKDVMFRSCCAVHCSVGARVVAPATNTPGQKNEKPALVRLEFRPFDLSRRDDEMLAKEHVVGDQFRPGPRRVFESTGRKLTGTGRFAQGTLDPGHHAGDLSADTEAEDREHAWVLCSMSVSRSRLARFEKLNDPAADEVCSQDNQPASARPDSPP